MNDSLNIDTNGWPKSVLRLFKIFTQINTHLTFLSSHARSTIPTFELIQKLNPSISKLDLTIIANLLPHGDAIFEYVDENQIMLSFAEKVQFDWSTGYKQSKASVLDAAYEEAAKLAESNSRSNQLLIFDFRDTTIDGIKAVFKDKKRRKVEIGDQERQEFFLSGKELKLQKLSHSQLMQMIKSRNQKFKLILNDYLKGFSEKELEEDITIKKLIEMNRDKIPIPPVLTDPVDLLKEKDSKVIDTLEKPDLNQMINTLKCKPFYKDQIVTIETLTPSKEAKYMQLSKETNVIHPELKDALLSYKNISLDGGLYTHQANALKALMSDDDSKNHVIVSTSTSSGKSLIYQLPIINDILWDITNGLTKRSTTALFIFPTKALAQDQKRHLQDLINHLSTNNKRKIIVETYDGDTPQKSKNYIRSYADIIFTNPDTIHASILPNHDKSYSNDLDWHCFLSNLKYVVMDELHVYKGTFGMHVSYVMCRLMRLTSRFNNECNNIQFISCSATISNPMSHFRVICSIPSDENIVHISDDGSPCSEKKLVVWNPPPLMNKKGQTQQTPSLSSKLKNPINSSFIPRESIISESAKLLLQLLSHLPNIKVIVFCPIRKVCELMMKEIRSILKSNGFNNITALKDNDIMSYRGGYSKSDRRIIEQKMFSGQLRAIIATNALELGIDLSDLDVVITCGFPMSKSNLHQQFGRAGRSNKSKGSLAIYVGGSNPIDQHYLKHPLELCDKNTYEDLCVEGLLDFGPNQLIMEMHLQCSAFEYPIDISNDLRWFVPDNTIVKNNAFIKLCQQKLYKDKNGRFRTNPKFLPWPVEHVSIRAIEETNYAVVDITNDRNIVIEEVEASRTSFTLYEGAIFLHQGYPYLVKEFNSDDRYAKVERVNVDWITQQRDFTDIDPIETELIKQLHPPCVGRASDIPVFFGKIQTEIIVFGYFKVNRRGEILEAVEVKNPPVILHSKGFWIDIPTTALNLIKDKHLSAAGGIHAAQHAIMNIVPLFLNGGATTNLNAKFSSIVGEVELITECKAPEKEFAQRQTKRIRPARLIFLDSKGGEQGSGVSAKTFEYIDDILHTTFLRVKDCECEWGCPQCVTASFCKEMSLVMSKPAAIIILAALLGLNLEEIKQEIVDGPEPNMPELKVETIQQVGAPIKFSKDVEIIEVRKARKSLSPIIKIEDANENHKFSRTNEEET